ncbi:hypothetical protein [Limnobacter sp. P1]|uniref:hypothetical protein n=1 Tax=Limnobacter olei TaxID=3031298 RepID=UPI0023B06C01|nr:hypothetical protein [Limnobacter sp. P1]
MNDLEKLCPKFLQTPNAAGIIAFLFNEFMDLEMRMAVPDAVAQQIGQYMQAYGYGIVFNKFYKQREEQILESVQQNYEEVMEDHRRLVRELDVLINGEEGAAKQASLCDIVAQVRREGLKVPQPADADESMWCRYIAGMIGQYIGEPLGSEKEKAIAGIIERRLWNFPRPTQPVDITHMVNRFLGWKLPMDFAPDCGISIDTEIAGRNGWPSGTNLFNAEQAKQMFEYVTKAQPVRPAVAVNDDLAKAVHYPDCWDVAAYPTLADALRELATCFQCCECVKNPAVAVNEQMYSALKMVMDDPQSLEGRPRTFECVTEAIGAYEAAKKGGV